MRIRPIPFDEFRRNLLAMYEFPLRAIATKREMVHVLNLVTELGVTTTADLDTGGLGQFGQEHVQGDAMPPGEVIERLKVAELGRASLGLTVAAEDRAAGGIICGHLPDRHRGMDRCPPPRPRFDVRLVRSHEPRVSLCCRPRRHRAAGRVNARKTGLPPQEG